MLYYFAGIIPLTGTTLSNTFKWFLKVELGPLSTIYVDIEMIESTLSSYRFILSGWEAIIYDQYSVLVVNSEYIYEFLSNTIFLVRKLLYCQILKIFTAASEIDQDKIDLVRGGEDSILGGALCSGTPVLFTKSVGLVSITPVDFPTQDFNTFVAFTQLYFQY